MHRFRQPVLKAARASAPEMTAIHRQYHHGWNARVTAKAGGDHNGSDGSGIGTGDDGDFTGTVTIGGNAAVIAAGSDEGCGIGSSDGENMNGIIIIRIMQRSLPTPEIRAQHRFRG